MALPAALAGLSLLPGIGLVATCVGSCAGAALCSGLKGLFCESGDSSMAERRKAAKFVYMGYFLVASVAAWLLRDYGQPLLELIPAFDACEQPVCYAKTAALRVTAGSAVFHGLLALVMLKVKRTSDSRDALQNANWTVKFLVWMLLMVCAFVIKNDAFIVYAQVARVFGGLFILVQLVILLDFVYEWNRDWLAQESEFYLGALLACSVVLYVVSGLSIAYMYEWFGGSGCELNQFLISLNLVFVLVSTAISLHPDVDGGLLTSAVISSYTVYYTYSGLISEPAGTCNPLAPTGWEGNEATATMQVGGFFLALASVGYSAVRAGTNTEAFDLAQDPAPPSPSLTASLAPTDVKFGAEDLDPEHGGASAYTPDHGRPGTGAYASAAPPERVADLAAMEPDGPVPYNYHFFQAIFSLASMYLAMLLIGWSLEGIEQERGSSIDHLTLDRGWASVWVKVVSAWVCSLLYIWTLVAPLLFPDREFY